MLEPARATTAQVTPVAAMLARAFAEDPVTLWLFGDERSRLDKLRRFFAFQLRHHYLPRGIVDLAAGTSAAALWMPPGALRPALRDRLAAPRLVGDLGAAYPQARRLGQLLALRHPRLPHYYLGILGTEPSEQRHGLGGGLVAAGCARADAEHVACYLECSNVENLAFYARFGFAVREEILAGPRGPRLWLMVRDAR